MILVRGPHKTVPRPKHTSHPSLTLRTLRILANEKLAPPIEFQPPLFTLCAELFLPTSLPDAFSEVTAVGFSPSQNFARSPPTAPISISGFELLSSPNARESIAPLNERFDAMASPFPQPGTAAWQEHRTPDGRTYYYNPLTKVTQWTKPEDMMSPAEVGPYISRVRRVSLRSC